VLGAEDPLAVGEQRLVDRDRPGSGAASDSMIRPEGRPDAAIASSALVTKLGK
jgi:hypothetical protein